MVKVYKAVREINGSFFSCVHNEHELQYRVGEITYPDIKNSAIFCFDYDANARAFLRDCLDGGLYAILECAGSNFWCDVKDLRVRWATDTAEYWVTMLNGGFQDRPPATKVLPWGTVLCSSIKPRKVLCRIML